MKKKTLKPNTTLVKSKNQSKKSNSAKKSSLQSLLGINNKSGLYQDSKKADEFIAKLRDEWD